VAGLVPLIVGWRTSVILGSVLALTGALIVLCLQFLDNHAWYWGAAHVLSVLAVASAAAGGLLLGRSSRHKHRSEKWLVCFGGSLLSMWGLSALGAVSLVGPAMNYLSGSILDSGIGWDIYQGDYVLGWYHLRLVQAAVATGLTGGLLLGFGLGAGDRDEKPPDPRPASEGVTGG
jgi:hypothetical protein